MEWEVGKRILAEIVNVFVPRDDSMKNENNVSDGV